ncbi:MAG: CehA/McbA family metallohydrolase [Clostridiales bacterium]|nr:CehA/McbA family metallohydrolase [Clostridiales bacterium]
MAKNHCKRLLSVILAALLTMSMTVCASVVTVSANTVDPISDSDFSEGVVSIKDVIAANDNDTITVLGQLVYRFGNFDNTNSAIIEDVIDGKVVALQLYNSLESFAIGDVVKLTGQKTTYQGIPQMQSITESSVVKSAGEIDCIPALEYDSFDALESDYSLSSWVKIKDVTLGAYAADKDTNGGNTVVTDKNGKTMNIYRAASYPAGVAEGEKVTLYACASAYKETHQLRVGSSKDYVVTNDTKGPVITLPEFSSASVGQDYTVSITVADNVGVESVKMTYKIGNTTGTLDMTKGNLADKYEATIPGNSITAGNKTINLSFVAKDAAGNETTEKGAIAVTDVPRITSVTPAANSATGSDKQPTITVNFENAGTNPTVELTVNGESVKAIVSGNTATYKPASKMEDGKVKVTAVVKRSDGESATYNWSFTIGESKFVIYAGQLHSHTAEYSDGAGTLEDAYEHVMGLDEYENVDFLAVTDHSNYLDSKDQLGTMDDASSGNGKWAEAKATTVEYNAKTDKLFVYGYEMTWSGGPGHINTYNTVGFVSRNNTDLNNKASDAGMQLYYQLLKDHPDTVSQFNHPGTTFGTFADFAYWDPQIDERITLVEVGNGEGAIGSSSYFPSYEYYTLALDKGWHVAPTNNQDNHKGVWGNANTARSCIITDDFTEQGLYDALKAMRVFSTEDQNLEIYYYLNDNIMGSILSDVGEKVHIVADIADPDNENIGSVSVIANGGVEVYNTKITSNSGNIDITLDNNYSYYFIKIVQEDGDICVTAPVWTRDVLKIGITSVETSSVIAVKGEPLTFTTTMFNYESAALNLESMIYTIDGEQVKAVESGLDSVPTGEEKKYTADIAPSKLGKQTVTVTVNAKLDGVPYVFTYNLDIDVLDPSEVINVGIDYGHANFYISGNYAGSDAAMIQLFAEHGIRANYVKDEITYDKIKDFAIYILTVPFKSYNVSVADALYSKDELEALKKYADNGGNLIVCSKSDRGNPTVTGQDGGGLIEEQKASTITNGILEAIGATSRIVEGIVVDNDKKANEAFRLYFTDSENYNYDNPFAAKIAETTNNSFSCYNGAPVLVGSNASPVVKGYDTTWGASFTANFTDSKYIPNYDADKVTVEMGDVAVMASETLPGGGWCLISGVTFFSTFEVKIDMDNIFTLQNSNYQMVMNIIDMIVPEPTITKIADVQAADEGLKFTIEGIVTSNASGFDKDTAFFDCIYAQDETAGINLFPVDGNFRIGQKVRVTGVTSSYNGERELKVSKIELINESINPIEPELVSNKDAMSNEKLGSLLKIKGVVSSLHYSSDGALETIMVKDANGDEARVFIDGYIMSDYTGLDNIAVGMPISAIGLASITVDTEGAEEYLHRLRVRNRAEIVFLGDADLNGTVNMEDIVLIQRVLANLAEFDIGGEAAADVTLDGQVNLEDVVLIQRFLAKLAVF